MEENNLLTNLEKISSKIPNRILKIEGFILKKDVKEELEIIIFRGFSSSTTHPIEIDLDKKVIELNHYFSNFKLYKAPLNQRPDNFIKQSQNYLFFLNQKNWI